MSKAQGLFIENQLGRKLVKVNKWGVHIQLFDSGERVLEIQNILSVRTWSSVSLKLEIILFVYSEGGEENMSRLFGKRGRSRALIMKEEGT